jgi:hypothetical protein
MADVEPLLTPLVEPPLAPRPPLADIRERAARHRRRRRIGGLVLGVPAVALVVAGLTLVSGGDVAVRTVGPVSEPPAPATHAPGPILIGTVAVGAREFRLTAEKRDGALCVGLIEGEHGRSRCEMIDSSVRLSPGILGTDGVQFAYGTARQDVAAVRVESLDGSTTTMDTLRGPVDLGVAFFAVPIPTSHYAAVIALDESGRELFRETNPGAPGGGG